MLLLSLLSIWALLGYIGSLIFIHKIKDKVTVLKTSESMYIINAGFLGVFSYLVGYYLYRKRFIETLKSYETNLSIHSESTSSLIEELGEKYEDKGGLS